MNLKKLIKLSCLLIVFSGILLFSCGEKTYNDFSDIIKDGQNAIGNMAILSLRYSNDLTGDFETLTKNDDLIILNMSDKYKKQMLEMTNHNNKFYTIKLKIVRMDHGTPVGSVIAIE